MTKKIELHNIHFTYTKFDNEKHPFIFSFDYASLTMKIYSSELSSPKVVMKLDSVPIKISRSWKGAISFNTLSGHVYVIYGTATRIIKPLVPDNELIVYYTCTDSHKTFETRLYCAKTMKYYICHGCSNIEEINFSYFESTDGVEVFDIVDKYSHNVKLYLQRLASNDQTDCVVYTQD